MDIADARGPDRDGIAVPRTRFLVALDLAAAAALGTLMTLSALSPTRDHMFSSPGWLRVAVGIASVSALALRRVVPMSALLLAIATSVGSWLVGAERDAFLTVALVLYILGSVRAPWRSGPLLALAAVATAGAYTLFRFPLGPVGLPPPWYGALAQSATSVAIEAVGWALGLAVYRQRSYVRAVRAQATQEVRAQRELAARAAAEERLRIARELHDVVAHAMSVITVQAGVARFILPVRPEQTGDALAVIESTGRQALRDMRQLLGVLRQDGDQSPKAPVPGLADLHDLVDLARAAGTEVELDISGLVRRLPEGLELSAYRIVQEALTNVVKHAGSPRARVALGYRPEELTITVLDDGPRRGSHLDPGPHLGRSADCLADEGIGGTTGAVGGHGLIGMRERAALHGGTLEAGPLPLRGYRVAARLPLTETERSVAA